MATFRLKARVTEDRLLEVDLPPSLQVGEEVENSLELPDAAWTDATPKTGAEIAAWLDSLDDTGWEHIEDGAVWVFEQRRKEQIRSQPP